MFLRKNNLDVDSPIMSANQRPMIAKVAAVRLIPLNPMNFSSRRFIEPQTEEDVGLLVQVSFDITVFTLPAYQRGSLPRPSKDVSS